jgi:hypothetical protein
MPRSPPKEKPIGEGESSSVPPKFLSRLAKLFVVGCFLAGLFLALAEWTCRRAEIGPGGCFFCAAPLPVQPIQFVFALSMERPENHEPFLLG